MMMMMTLVMTMMVTIMAVTMTLAMTTVVPMMNKQLFNFYLVFAHVTFHC